MFCRKVVYLENILRRCYNRDGVCKRYFGKSKFLRWAWALNFRVYVKRGIDLG
ncbi:hypothetical protein NSE_0233 [Neorickettsia sennetsu str. Miyayama]|uniref:Uncharacterized protein n=1 Tax=Ehrlichia sennetsu (strain ATCC VR-367 / Miyayama) TaxID=222891 RepID=Q2GEG9_EHRS3|nr:hypothetical protein NSE_0233 [Neorickettsia sennetsu str. Miyayama]